MDELSTQIRELATQKSLSIIFRNRKFSAGELLAKRRKDFEFFMEICIFGQFYSFHYINELQTYPVHNKLVN